LRMADVIQRASTGRSKCRACERAIAKGELRFGETVPNPYGEGDATLWFHLTCAACMRSERLEPALSATDEQVPDRSWLERQAALGVAHPRLQRLARAELSPSARARCRECSNPIEKGVWRFSLHVFEDGRANPIGTIHASCAAAYFGTRELMERVRRLCPEIDDPAAGEIACLLEQSSPAPADALAKTRGAASEDEVGEPEPTRRSAS
jgi:hypothetical protein